MKITHFPFVKDADTKLIRTDILKNPAKFLEEKMTGSKFNFGVSELVSDGSYKEGGWYYGFRILLKHYLYKQHGQWHDVYALNKGNLRKLTIGRIDRIVEL